MQGSIQRDHMAQNTIASAPNWENKCVDCQILKIQKILKKHENEWV